MSPSVTMFGLRFGDLDADGLLAGNRREDADLGRGERVADVVLERGHLGDLRARRQLELVARDPRAGDLTHDRRVDAEVRQRLDERLGDPAVSFCRPPRGGRAAQDRAIRERVVAVGLERVLEDRRDRDLGLLLGVHEQGRRVADDVGVVVDDVDRRLYHLAARRHERLAPGLRERAPPRGRANRTPRLPQQGAQ